MTSCQSVWHTRIVLRNVAVVVVNGFLPFEFGTICEVFGVDRADDRLPSYGCPWWPGSRRRARAQRLHHRPLLRAGAAGRGGPDRAAAVDDDRLCIFAAPGSKPPGGRPCPGPSRRKLLEALRRAVDRGTRVLSICTGAFILGEAGLLGRPPLHHALAERGRARPPLPGGQVDPDVLYVDDDR